MFIDGVLLSAHTIMALAEMPRQERLQQIAKDRLLMKSFACDAVNNYMRALHVSREEMLHYWRSHEE